MIDCRGCRWVETHLLKKTCRCLKFIHTLGGGDISEGNVIIPCSECGGRYWEGIPGEIRTVGPNDTILINPKKDTVNHPSHYTSGKIEVIDIMESIITSMPLTPWEATLTAQVVKYIARWKNKGGVEDLKKAEWYLKRLIGAVEK